MGAGVLGRRELSAALLALAALVFYTVLLSVQPSIAQQDLDCSDFRYQEDAQEELEQDPSDPNGLDRDNDGIACETLPSRGGGTPDGASGDLDCSDFEFQEEAQDELESERSDPNNLDEDNDRIACESLPRRSGGSTDRDDTTTGEQSIRQATTPTPSREQTGGVIRQTIPKKPLPPTGGLPVYAMVGGSILVGAGLLGIGFVVCGGPRQR